MENLDEKIALLPRFAKVAFAAHCAREVLHLNSSPRVTRAVELAEELSRSLGGSSVEDARAAGRAARDAADTDDARAANAAYAAYAAVNAAYAAYNEAPYAYVAADEVVKAAEAASAASTADNRDESWIHKDLSDLVHLAERLGWDDDTPVPPTVFTSFRLTSLPKPKVWTNDLLIEIDPGSAPPEVIAEYFDKLDRVYKSRGGSGLTFKPEGTGTAVVRKGVLA